MLDKPLGSEIDDFDKVLRFNEYELDGYEQYVGSKTDILCVPANKILLDIHKRPELTSQKNVSEIWYARPKDWVDQIGFDLKHFTNVKRVLQITDTEFNFIHIKNGLQFSPPWLSTGLVAIYMAINNCSEYDIYVHGFDGFKSGHYYDPNTDKLPRYAVAHKANNEMNIINKLIRFRQIKKL